MLTLAGCFGYHVGNQSLYAPDVQTVSLQMFGSDSFRRGLGEWLTEAVGKEIEDRTPYKIARSTEADSTISGRLLAETKRGTVETINDDLRELDVALYVQFEWRKHDGELIRQGQPIPLCGILRDTYAHNALVPEVGQTMVTAQQRAIEQLAQQIVDQMEAPW